MRRALLSYLCRRGLSDGFAAVVVSLGLGTLMWWFCALAGLPQ